MSDFFKFQVLWTPEYLGMSLTASQATFNLAFASATSHIIRFSKCTLANLQLGWEPTVTDNGQLDYNCLFIHVQLATLLVVFLVFSQKL